MARSGSELFRLALRFSSRLRREWPLALRASLAMVLITAVALATPWVHKKIVDDALLRRDASVFWPLLLLLVVLALAQLLLGLLRSYDLMRLRVKILFRVRADFVERLEFLPLEYYRSVNPGYVMARLGSDVERLVPLFGDALLGVLQNTLLVLAGIPLVFYLSPGLALLVACLVPFYLLNHWFFAGRIRRVSAENQELFAKVWARLEENLTIITSVKLFGRELREAIRYVRASKVASRHQVRLALVQAAAGLCTDVFTSLGPIAVLAYAGARIIGGAMTLGELIAFSVYMGMLIGPVRSLFQYGLGIQGALASLERVYDVLDLAPEPGLRDEGLDELRGFTGRIAFRDVRFAYRPGEPVLDGLTLEIAPGEAIVLEGANGSGKTTLVNLLVGLLRPSGGEILLDGRPLARVSLRALRRKVGVVSRDNFFFNASIRENIAYGRRGATGDEILRAADLARVTEFASELPDGLDSSLGERGDRLSRGQLQRVALARALVRDPVVLVLDEGTASIDRRSKELIQRALEDFHGKKTVIYITHEDPLPAHDRAYVLENGRIRPRPAPGEPPERSGRSEEEGRAPR